jgi:hypothetical protein
MLGLDRQSYQSIHLLQPFNSWAAQHYAVDRDEQTLISMLEAAYQKGHADAKAEIRAALGVRPPERM